MSRHYEAVAFTPYDRSRMWRRCDLHVHTMPNEKDGSDFDPEALVAALDAANIDVAAITDHDTAERCGAVIDAASRRDIEVLAGMEIRTQRGDVLVIAPERPAAIDEFADRLGVGAEERLELDDLVKRLKSRTSLGCAFESELLLVGAHVDQPSSLLGPSQTFDVASQLEAAIPFEALEVSSMDTVQQWLARGVKQQDFRKPLVRFSDAHSPATVGDRATWLYLPDLSVSSFRQAFATPEASMRFDNPPPPPECVIESVEFVGGLHDGVCFEFTERMNVIIGPPLSGKTLVLDALRLAFDSLCPIADIRRDAEARLLRAVGQGSQVVVTGKGPAGPFRLVKLIGGAERPDLPFMPVAFSQTELVRRGMERRPSMALLDVHAPSVRSVIDSLQTATEVFISDFQAAIATARRIHPLIEELGNPEDGLEASRSLLQSLAPTEETARRAVDVTRLERWRSEAREEVQRWRDEMVPPQGPDLAGPPQIASFDPSEFLLGDVPQDAIERFAGRVHDAAREAADDILAQLDSATAQFETLKNSTEALLQADGFGEGSDALETIQRVRARVAALEAKDQERQDLVTRLRMQIDGLLRAITEVVELRDRLREERRQTCSDVNASMRTFFSSLAYGGQTERVDELLDSVREGTYMRREGLPAIRESLDRPRLVEVALRHAAGLEPLEGVPEFDDQDQIARNGIDRGREVELARSAVYWPGDALELTHLDDQTPFTELTEGLRALAIKEISFAASSVPAISDQPEDAVPPQAVYENLVPAVRKQRASRQFVLVSHDANLVVAGDADRVWVLNPGDAPISGRLEDEPVRQAALDLLEGGREAFEQRTRRYSPNLRRG